MDSPISLLIWRLTKLGDIGLAAYNETQPVFDCSPALGHCAGGRAARRKILKATGVGVADLR